MPKELFNRISKKSYNGNLQIVNEIQSVNCKEWEAEKKYLEKVMGRRYPMATRYYVNIKNGNEKDLQEHTHKGHIDFRPISTSISDAFLPIPNKNRFFVTCKKSYKSDDPFNPTIDTVPFATPTKELSACSPASLWIVLTTLSYEYGGDFLSLVNINESLPDTSNGKAVGLREYNNLFKNLKYSAHFYIGKNRKKELYDFYKDVRVDSLKSPINFLLSSISRYWNNRKFARIEEDYKKTIMNWDVLYAYIESEIPVYMVFKWDDLRRKHQCGEPSDSFHSVVAIGHTLDEKSNILNFIIHDVSCAPFLEIPRNMIDECLQEALVFLPEDVNVRYEDLQTILLKVIKMYNILFDNILKEGMNPPFRFFLMRSQRIKFWYTNQKIYPPDVIKMYSQADFPHYVWVVEIGTPELKEKNRCLGQIIIDATSIKRSMGVVLLNLPKYRLWYQNSELKEERLETPAYSDLPLFRDQTAWFGGTS
ncbi:MAG: hypothetical protein KAT05_13825 [Spirochaetes bacterium]|nr:hypothetical protein [Spirochaetota bacterium]